MNRTNKVRLTESQLHRIIKESVKKALNELDLNGYDKDIYWQASTILSNGQTKLLSLKDIREVNSIIEELKELGKDILCSKLESMEENYFDRICGIAQDMIQSNGINNIKQVTMLHTIANTLQNSSNPKYGSIASDIKNELSEFEDVTVDGDFVVTDCPYCDGTGKIYKNM